VIALLLAAAVSTARLDGIDAAVHESIAKGETPGAVVLVESRGHILLRRAYGSRAVLPARENMTISTVFDVASLTKVAATATSVMILVEQGRIQLSDPVVRHIPEFGAGGGER